MDHERLAKAANNLVRVIRDNYLLDSETRDAVELVEAAVAQPTHPHDGYAYDNCKCVCCLNVRALASPAAPPDRMACCGHSAEQHLWSGGCNRCQCPAMRVGTLPDTHTARSHEWTTDDRHDYEWCLRCLHVRQANGSSDAKPCKGPTKVTLRATDVVASLREPSSDDAAPDRPAWFWDGWHAALDAVEERLRGDS